MSKKLGSKRYTTTAVHVGCTWKRGREVSTRTDQYLLNNVGSSYRRSGSTLNRTPELHWQKVEFDVGRGPDNSSKW